MNSLFSKFRCFAKEYFSSLGTEACRDASLACIALVIALRLFVEGDMVVVADGVDPRGVDGDDDAALAVEDGDAAIQAQDGCDVNGRCFGRRGKGGGGGCACACACAQMELES